MRTGTASQNLKLAKNDHEGGRPGVRHPRCARSIVTGRSSRRASFRRGGHRPRRRDSGEDVTPKLR